MAFIVVLRNIKDVMYANNDHVLSLKINDKVIVETEHGLECGIICDEAKDIIADNNSMTITCKILRKMTDNDKEKIIENKIRSLKIKNMILKKIKHYCLDMKLTCVQYVFDRSKLFVYYTSENRVDFRKFIKDLGHALKTRIQMVQIGVRDESRIFGGIGTCGRILCCSNFLKNFNSVTVDMIKEQSLSLNTSKLSGLCGRLMCCIFYENETYRCIKKKLPEIGKIVSTPDGNGKLISVDCIKEIVVVEFDVGVIKTFDISKIV
ncbi:MAG: stage 0 sporulation protein [Endomicrobium sp.]|jgi:cell fate regulator YaaT (PSP1 superfamily)|nr:stage 0 sporulation protein [Endomicrobium sp.]